LKRIILTLSACLILCSCGMPKSGETDDYLVRVGQQVITQADFEETFEIATDAYPYQLKTDMDEYKTAMMWHLNQKIEEAVLLERAREIGIEISDAELEQEISTIKKDYADDVFENLLVERAVSYASWKKEFKRRLLIERLLKAELEDGVVITPEEISSRRESYEKEKKQEKKQELEMKAEMKAKAKVQSKPDASSEEQSRAIIVNQLRRKKIEGAYIPWIKDLRKRYKTDVNLKLWKKMSGNEPETIKK